MKTTGLKLFRADLHIHSCLSPCGDWDMSPSTIVGRCIEKNIDIIALTDHNSAENTAVTVKIGQKAGLIVLPGMEICSAEEVHVVAIFGTVDAALSMQDYIYEYLPGENLPDVFGYQVVADENDDVVRQNEKMLIGAANLSINAIVAKIHELEGLAIAAHIDKKAFSLPVQLGFIPPDLMLDAVEVSFRERPESAAARLIPGMDIPCITASDSHFPDEIGRVTTKFYMKAPTLAEIKKALTGRDGRCIVYSGSKKKESEE